MRNRHGWSIWGRRGQCALKEKLTPYKLDTQQGHVLAPEAVAKLKTGMTKEQVRFLLGTPLINDLFNPDRLFHLYRNQKGGGPIEQGKLTLYFEQNKLVRIESDLIPQPAAVATATEPPVRRETAGTLAPTAVPLAANTENESVAAARVQAPVVVQRLESIRPPASIQPPVSIQPSVSVQPPLQPAARPAAVSDENLVAQTIQDWLRAWMKQDVEAYLAFYAKDFKAPDNEPRNKWEQTRRARVSQPKKIEIRLSSLKVQIADAQTATAFFRQEYRSDAYADKVNKELSFIKENGAWRIRQERVVKASGLPQDR